MTNAVLNEAADRLGRAAADGVPCRPVRELIGNDDISAAYQVQRSLIGRRLASGAVQVGRKIGLTSAAVQQQLGVSQPDFGVLLDDMAVRPGGVVPIRRLLQPRVEGEIAFRLRADLGKQASRADVIAAVASAHAAIEIVDSRIAGWDISIADTVADNASSGMFAVSAQAVPLRDVEPAEVAMSLSVNGRTVSTGNGSACLGDPLSALAWLAHAAAEFGDPLRAGELVLSGALGPVMPVAAGDEVCVQMTGLGGVCVTFGAED